MFNKKLLLEPFRAWIRFVKEARHEKQARKVLTQEKRIKQLEEQLAKVSGELKELQTKVTSSICVTSDLLLIVILRPDS
jgi:hypothetical protein